MRGQSRFVFAGWLLALGGCGSGSTAHWIDQLKSSEPKTRLQAVHILQQRKQDAAQIVPALIESLKDENSFIRRDAAWTLGSFGEESRNAIPSLQEALHDREPSVRKAAARSLNQIAPAAGEAKRPGNAHAAHSR